MFVLSWVHASFRGYRIILVQEDKRRRPADLLIANLSQSLTLVAATSRRAPDSGEGRMNEQPHSSEDKSSPTILSRVVAAH